jgi:transcriptional regulator with XRE-family HTH domain
MDASDESRTIGQRARTIRRRRGLTVEVAAGLAGISKGYLSLLERGHRRFERRGLLDALAAALSCSVADLTGQPYMPVDRATADALACLPGIAIAVHDATLDDPPDDLPPRPLPLLVEAVDRANYHLDEARFGLAAHELDTILTELHVLAATGDTDSRRTALAALADACIVATSIARHLGHHELAVQTARRGHEAATRHGGADRIGLLAMHRALGLTWIGAQRRAGAVLDGALADLMPVADPSATETTAAQTAGMLHLTAALHHAQQDRASQADEHLGEAKQLASRTGETNWLYQHFGPAHVALWEVEIGVELDRGPAVAERLAPDVPALTDALGSANRRCVLAFDLARAYGQAEGQRDGEAVRYLDMADRYTSQVRNVPVARELVSAMDRRARRRVWELDSLRNRFGVN